AERVYDESQRMISLVEDLMRISRLDEGAEDVERVPLSLMELAEDAVKRLKPSAEEKNISLNISGDSGALTGVKPLLSELVYNLCDNAIKYNRENGRVDINIKEDEKRVVLSVSDTGIGIEHESLDRVFERFYRVDKSHSKAIGGTGLGLSIVKHAALLHGAGIELDSEPGKGTEVRVSFPV
ncbi:MAG TPA: ATP-binding protein, partial [Bacillota bacterium]|nr:ATP-binding protein [Bacillota bacterium]